MTAVRRRRGVLGATLVAGMGLLGSGLGARPGSAAFYGFTGATAATWAGGALVDGPVPAGRSAHPVLVPVAIGAGVFGAFYAAALVSVRVPPLRRAIRSVLGHYEAGSGLPVVLTTLANGAAEELFFRGAVYDAAGARPVATSTAVYVVATTATRNPALVLASGVLGTVLGLQRRATGGVAAPLLTHVTWSALMLRFMPPLFSRS
ncbi:CPBP family intramembrane glutamic endopeptidase [Actinomycetes bacterium KLBMP 9759]